MPSRKPGVAGRVLKSTKLRKSLSPIEKEQIQDFVQNSQSSQDTNNYFASQNDPDTPVPGSSCNTSFSDTLDATGANLQNGGPIGGDPHAGPLPHGLNPGAAYDLGAVGTQARAQHVISQQQQHQQPQASAARTAGDVAFGIYGEEVKIEGGLCGKLATQPAQREPKQRRNDQKLNLERRGNVEALLAHTAGEQAPRPCKNCHKGHGPFTTCVVYDGQMCGSCANCWFNASGSRCTFQENYHYYPPPMLAPPVVSSQAHVVVAPAAAASVASSSIPSSSGPLSVTPVPIAPALAPAPACVSTSPAYQPAAVNDSFVSQGSVQHPPPVEHPVPGLSEQPFISDQAGRLINDAFERASRYNTTQRMQARIDAAAQALGMAIMDYENYVNSVQGENLFHQYSPMLWEGLDMHGLVTPGQGSSARSSQS